MLYRKFNNETGNYLTSEGHRVMLASARALTADQLPLWTWFDTKEDCLAAWNLTYDPMPEPEPEN